MEYPSELRMIETVPVAAIVVVYDRVEQSQRTLQRLLDCRPAPAEILVHFDSGSNFEVPNQVQCLHSAANLGPGGGRNLLVRTAKSEWVASFDDDSYPEDGDYFQRVWEASERYPEAGVLMGTVRHRDGVDDGLPMLKEGGIASFVGCGCVYRRSAFLQTSGYVPLPVAYGMEEVDLALQLQSLQISIIEIPSLRIFHDTDLKHHDTSKITAGSIMNQALLVWLRYPIALFPYGLLQYGNQVVDNLRRRRWLGVLSGLVQTPLHLWKYRKLRAPVSSRVILDHRALRLSRNA
jgi:GT2 family glycosyltransferase